MRNDTTNATTRAANRPVITTAILLLLASPSDGAVIGVLNDGRQVEGLSLIEVTSAAKVALQTDGHTIIELGPGSLDALPVLETVDIVWLPLLDSAEAYTSQERTNLVLYAFNGGRIVWIGDADVYNASDDSFLTAFGLAKNAGNFATALAPAIPDHPIVTGPDGAVATIGTNASYGLFTSSLDVADVFVGQPGPGTVIGCMDADSGYAGAGRVALVCDSTMFGQLLLQDDHRSLLLNIVRWAEAAEGYTPSGTDIVVGPFSGACAACTTTTTTFSHVTVTGETSLAAMGSGRCSFTGIPSEALPADFLGYGLSVETTATLNVPSTVGLSIAYDLAALTALGIVDDGALKVYQYDDAAGVCIDITTGLDTTARTITGLAEAAGAFLFGAVVPTEDCDANGVPDECELEGNDCNGDSILDACQLTANDCNNNGIPDDCEADVIVTLVAEPVSAGTVEVTVGGSSPYPICTSLTLEATPVDGHCFSEWTVDAGTAPNDTLAAMTTLSADVDKTVTAHFIPIIVAQPADASACEGDAAALSVQVHADLAAGATYQWHFEGELLADGGAISGATTSTLAVAPASLAHDGSYHCIVTHTCATAASDEARLNVSADPAIIDSPTDRLVCPGDTIEIEVQATGAELVYQWQFDAGSGFADLTDDAVIGGSDNATLVLTQLGPAQAGFYQCVVTGACGGPATSTPAQLTVGDEPQITTDPTDAVKCPGETVTFSAAAGGTDLTFQWWYDDGGPPLQVFDDANISGATTPDLTIANLDASHSGSYQCVVTGLCGTPAQSAPAVLSVGVTMAIVAGPDDQTVCPGETAFFTASAIGTGVAFQWQFSDGQGFLDLADSADISGATTGSLALSNVLPGQQGDYRCVVSGDCGDDTATDGAHLTVQTVVSVTAQPSDQALCTGGEAAFSVAATGVGLSYQWMFNDGAAFEPLSDGGAVSGCQTDTLTLTGVDVTHVGQYQCVVSGACGDAILSYAAVLTVTIAACDCNANGVPDGDDIAAGTVEDCNGNGLPDACEIDIGSPAGGGPFYCVENCDPDCNVNGIPDDCDIVSATSNDCNENGLPDECELADNDCNADSIPDDCQLAGNDCNGNSVPDECEVPYIADAGSDITQCTGRLSPPLGGGVVASGSTPPYTYDWQVTSGPAEGGDLPTPAAERARFIATLPGEYEIELTVTDSSSPPCVVTDTVVVTAYEMLVDAGTDHRVCADGTGPAFGPVVTGGVEPLTYAWTIEPGSPSLSAAQFTGDGPAAASPTFTPDMPGEYTLRLTVADSGQAGCVVSDTLTYHAASMTIGVPDDFAMCVSGESAPIEAIVTSGGTPPFSFEWTIADGSADTSPLQFGAGGPSVADPTLSPTTVGEYVLEVSVHDSSETPCEQVATVRVSVGVLTVDAGTEGTQCVGAGGIRLAPSVTGGHGDLIHSWSIEPGSPSVDPQQFTSPHSFDATPLFIPSAIGNYILRLTVTDSATPACSASDTVVIRSTSMTVDAGDDFVTQAFESSRALGAIPVVGGGIAPVTYEWTILAGPDTHYSQLSNSHAARPMLTPAEVGTYTLEVTVTDAGGAGCQVTDHVVIEAITAQRTLPINNEGRVFMALRIDEPHTAAEFRLAGGEPGVGVVGELLDDGATANFAGLIPIAGLSRRLFLSADLAPGGYAAVVAMQYADDELAGVDPLTLQVQWYDSSLGAWRPAGDGSIESGSFPARPTAADSGRCGVDRPRNTVWVVVDYMGEFSIGQSTGDAPPVNEPPPAADPGAAAAAPLCGVFGAPLMMSLMLACWARAAGRRRLIRAVPARRDKEVGAPSFQDGGLKRM